MRKMCIAVSILLIAVIAQAAEFAYEKNILFDISGQQSYQNGNSIFKPPFGANAGSGSYAFAVVPDFRADYGGLRFETSVRFHMSGGTPVTGTVREAYLNAELGSMRFSGGRKILQWGTAYFFNPIGSFIPSKSATDLSDSGKANVGTDCVRWDIFGEHLSAGGLVYYKNDNYGYAGLLYAGTDAVDTYWMVHDGGNGELEYGAAFATTLTDFLEVHGEVVRRRSVDVTAHRADDAVNPRVSFGSDGLITKEYDTPVMWVAGVNATLGDVSIIAEWYHSDAGIGEREWENEKVYFAYNSDRIMDDFDALDDCSTIWTLLRQQYRFRDYGFIRAAGTVDGYDLSGIAIMNMADYSVMCIAAVGKGLTDSMSLSVNVITMGGEKGSEYRESIIGTIVSSSLRITF